MAFFVSSKNRASPNFAQPELARLPYFLYLRESSQDIPKIMFKSYTSNDNLLLPPWCRQENESEGKTCKEVMA